MKSTCFVHYWIQFCTELPWCSQITECDAGVLKDSKDIKCSTLDDPAVNKGFKLDFYFDTNPYF